MILLARKIILPCMVLLLSVAMLSGSSHAQGLVTKKYTVNFDIRIDTIPDVSEVSYQCTYWDDKGKQVPGSGKMKSASFNSSQTKGNVFKSITDVIESSTTVQRYECRIVKFTVAIKSPAGTTFKTVPPDFQFSHVLNMPRSVLSMKGSFNRQPLGR